jgi:ketosteroid isomerase-like protein
MSEENVEVVRKAYEAFARAGPDGMFEFMDPEIDYRAIEGALDDIGVFRGYEAQRRYLTQWIELFDDFQAEVEELIDAGDRVVAMVHISGRMKESEARVEMRFGVVWTVRDGKVVSGREYATREEALAAAGLPA